MIVRNANGDYDVSGTVVYLSDLWNYFNEEVLLKDMQEGRINARKWTEETVDVEKLQDFLNGNTVLSGLVVRKYLDYKSMSCSDSVEFSELKKIMNLKFETYETMMRSILIKLNELLSQFCRDQFLGLKEIAEDYSYRGKRIYSVKTLRNKIRVEKFGDKEIGHLDIDDLHLVFIKRGMKWITTLLQWQEQKSKLDYNHFWKRINAKKYTPKSLKFCQKVCAE